MTSTILVVPTFPRFRCNHVAVRIHCRYRLIRLVAVVVVGACCCCGPNIAVVTNASVVLADATSSLSDADPSPTISPIVKHDGMFSTIDRKRISTFEVPREVLTLAGNQQPISRSILRSVRPKQEQYLSVIRKSIQSMVHLEDITLLGFLSWMTVPIGQSIYEWLPSLIPQYNNSVEFRKTLYYEVVDHIQQIARLALAIYCTDVIKLIVIGLGYKIPGMISTEAATPHAFSHIVYTVWIANRIGYVNRKLLRRYINAHPESFGRINLIQKWIDAIRFAATVLLVMHILRVESGVAINRSFLAVGSVGTLAFGLASQGIATQVINGLLLASSDRIYEGDDVMLGSNGFAGNIVKLGWLETVIRGRYVLCSMYPLSLCFCICRYTRYTLTDRRSFFLSDEIMISIPNADLLKERLSNLSRVRHSQVKQVLRLRYDDVDKIPPLIEQIKHEIKKNCPSLILDGSRPFRVHWTAMNHDHCEITVDTRHMIKPVGDAYLDNKQNVLTAIYTALKRYNCRLVDNPIVMKNP